MQPRHLLINLARSATAKAISSSGSIPGMAVLTTKSRAICAIPGKMRLNLTMNRWISPTMHPQKSIASLLPIPTRQQPNLHTFQEVSTQQTQNRITQHDLSSLPIRIMVVGYRYKVDFGPSVKPQVHLVDQQQHCSCELDTACPAIKAVAEYLRNGGKRAPEPLPPCPICGAETFHDRDWDNKYTHELGWRCTTGGLTHFLQAKTEKIKEAFRRKYSAVSEHENIAGR